MNNLEASRIIRNILKRQQYLKDVRTGEGFTVNEIGALNKAVKELDKEHARTCQKEQKHSNFENRQYCPSIYEEDMEK